MWAFKMAQTDRAMADVMTRYMANHNVKTVGFIGFADSYGESWLNEFSEVCRRCAHIETGRDRALSTAPTRASPGQILKLMAAKPDAVLIAGAGTPTVLPQRTLDRARLQGRDLSDARHRDAGVHQARRQGRRRHAVSDAAGRRRAHAAGRSSVEEGGARVRERLRGEVRRRARVTQFAGDAAGVYPRLQDAVTRALKAGAAGHAGVSAWRCATNSSDAHELVVPNGVVSTSATDHVGLDQRASVMGIIKNGKFMYLSQ